MIEIEKSEVFNRLTYGEKLFIIEEITPDTPIDSIMKAKRIAVIGESQAPKAPVKTPVKKTAKKKPAKQIKKVVDSGKILALHKANWKPEKIADEMGISTQTVYNHIKKAEANNETADDI